VADERLLNGIRRFWTPEQVRTAYQAVLAAYTSGAAEATVIVGTNFDGTQTNAEVVLDREAMRELLDVYEQRLVELDAVAAGDPVAVDGAQVMDFSGRRVGT
jgi:cell shape-determining protein MreC